MSAWLLDSGQVLLVLIVPIAAAGIGVALWRLRRDTDGAVDRTIREVAVVLALALIVVATLLTPSPGLGDLEPAQIRIKWMPFDDLIDALMGHGRLRVTIVEMASNVVLFVPLGLALRWRQPSLAVGRVMLIAGVISVGVELLQALLAPDRWPSTTDVIMNTVGGGIGAAMAGIARSPVDER